MDKFDEGQSNSNANGDVSRQNGHNGVENADFANSKKLVNGHLVNGNANGCKISNGVSSKTNTVSLN